MTALLTGVTADLGSSAGYLLASSAPVSSPPMTLGCWIRLSTVASTSTPVCIKSDDNSKLLQIYFFGGSQSITVQITDNGGGSSTFLQATSLGWSADEWHHIGFRWEADNTVSLWIDGIEADSDTSTKDISASTSIRFGGNTAGSSSFYGLLSHPFIAGKSLSDTALLAIGTEPAANPQEYLDSTDYYWEDLTGAGPHASVLATLALTESGTVGDGGSDPQVNEKFVPTSRTIHGNVATGGTLLSSELNSLADDAYSAAGTAYSNASARYIYGDIEVYTTFASAPSADGQFKVFLLGALDGSNYADGGGSVAPPETACVGVLPLRAATGAQRVTLCGVVLPPCSFKLVLRNESGRSLPSSGSTVKLFAYNDEIDTEVE